jgi:hypothetical protein
MACRSSIDVATRQCAGLSRTFVACCCQPVSALLGEPISAELIVSGVV